MIGTSRRLFFWIIKAKFTLKTFATCIETTEAWNTINKLVCTEPHQKFITTGTNRISTGVSFILFLRSLFCTLLINKKLNLHVLAVRLVCCFYFVKDKCSSITFKSLFSVWICFVKKIITSYLWFTVYFTLI